jgi:hypothetical protein
LGEHNISEVALGEEFNLSRAFNELIFFQVGRASIRVDIFSGVAVVNHYI